MPPPIAVKTTTVPIPVNLDLQTTARFAVQMSRMAISSQRAQRCVKLAVIPAMRKAAIYVYNPKTVVREVSDVSMSPEVLARYRNAWIISGEIVQMERVLMLPVIQTKPIVVNVSMEPIAA